MQLSSLIRPIGAVCIALAGLPTMDQTKWRLPVTIEALQDVTAHAGDTGRQARGVLYVGRGQSFTIESTNSPTTRCS